MKTLMKLNLIGTASGQPVMTNSDLTKLILERNEDLGMDEGYQVEKKRGRTGQKPPVRTHLHLLPNVLAM